MNIIYTFVVVITMQPIKRHEQLIKYSHCKQVFEVKIDFRLSPLNWGYTENPKNVTVITKGMK